MLERIRAFLRDGGEAGSGGTGPDDLSLAVAGLLVEAAHQDGVFDEAERATIGRLLEDRLALKSEEAAALIADADAKVQGASDLWSFAQVIKNRFDHDERVRMIEMLWEVVYADGELHDYEANLMRRVAGLVYVSDAESGSARKRVLGRLGING
ncbi:MAG TPA: TerB family tellurite resistance protein [Alphaproteobacteria bacterium]|nr:TerB family tellurite resistance protein [Alphaproteobacteria bacterium]